MYSILIPNYNSTNILKLVRMLHFLASEEQIEFEIIVLDDASTNEKLNLIYTEFSYCPNIQIVRLRENKGRTYARNYLANLAVYPWLLFMDSDTIPQDKMFIKNYLKAIFLKDVDAVFGGVFFGFMPPDQKNRMLRYYYGSQREHLPLKIREEQVYISINSGCFAIRKKLFLNLSIPEENRYGMDVYFAYQLKKRALKIKHIEAFAEVKIIETNEVFIQKTVNAIQTLHYLVSNKLISNDFTPLLRAYNKLKKWNLTVLYLNISTKLERHIVRNLFSTKPSLRFFDFYRLMLYVRIAKG